MDDKRREWLNIISESELPPAHRKISEIIGIKATIALCEAYGGSAAYIPTLDAVYDAARKKLIRAEFEKGAKVSVLAHRYETTERTVQRIVEDIRPEQISMFDAADAKNESAN